MIIFVVIDCIWNERFIQQDKKWHPPISECIGNREGIQSELTS